MATPVCIRYGESLDEGTVAGTVVLGLVPSELVAIREVELPSGGRRHLEQLVKFATEESLAEDVEDLHFAIQAIEKGIATVFISRHDDMNEWLDWYRERDVELCGLVPDFFTLPHREDGWVCRMDGGRTLVRSGALSGFAIPPELFSACLASSDSDTERGTIHLAGDTSEADLRGQINDASWQVAELSEGSVDCPTSPGLCVGPYKPRGKGGYRTWLLAASLLLAALLVDVGISAHRYYETISHTTKIQEETEQLFRETFPSVERIVDVEAQAMQAYQSLQAAKMEQETGFLALLAPVVKAIQSVRGSQLTSLRYRDKELHMRLESPQPTALRSKLSEYGLNVQEKGKEWVLRWRQDV